ncbi:MAG: adenylate/guanylate cyclase domain-containing protein [Pseudomonadota bacterium]
MKRKLTTIFCADAVGYSGLMEGDEDGTLSRLNRAKAIMADLFERYDGRKVNSWGDAVIAEFPSVVQAVRCAVDIQDAIHTETVGETGPALRFRIGINLGDVMEQEGDLYGDGVNVAARLQTIAEPGGIVVSGTVYSLVHKQLSVGFDFLGAQSVKSLDEPVPSYSIRMPQRNAPPEIAAPGEAAPPPAPQSPFARLAAQADAALTWIRAQPRNIQRYAGLIAFFATLNVLFTGIAVPWFVFPSAPFAFLIWRHYRRTTGSPAE